MLLAAGARGSEQKGCGPAPLRARSSLRAPSTAAAALRSYRAHAGPGMQSERLRGSTARPISNTCAHTVVKTTTGTDPVPIQPAVRSPAAIGKGELQPPCEPARCPVRNGSLQVKPRPLRREKQFFSSLHLTTSTSPIRCRAKVSTAAKVFPCRAVKIKYHRIQQSR